MMASRITAGALDFLTQRAKPLAKRVYRPIVISSARVWRRLLHAEFIGITGSAGKTTTKDLLHAILVTHGSAVRSHDSNNQLYDTARMLIGTPPRARYAVQEVGASEPGGLDPILALLRPRVGVVTSVGEDHFTAFRGPDAVAAEKSKLIASLPANGIAVLNADDARVLAMAARARCRIVTFGTSPDAQLRALQVAARWPDPLRLQILWQGREHEVRTQLHGEHQSVCVLAALATSCALGVPLEVAAAVVAQFPPPTGRMSTWVSPGGVHFLRDDYKAPWWSLPASLQVLAQANAARRIIVLGTVSDYGVKSRKVYRLAVSMALQSAEIVIVAGERAGSLAQHFAAEAGTRLQCFTTVQAAGAWLRSAVLPGDLVLLKGSMRDHLSRLALQFGHDVRCWRQSCKRMHFCERCPLLGSEHP